jgi:hypothetical protein
MKTITIFFNRNGVRISQEIEMDDCQTINVDLRALSCSTVNMYSSVSSPDPESAGQ